MPRRRDDYEDEEEDDFDEEEDDEYDDRGGKAGRKRSRSQYTDEAAYEDDEEEEEDDDDEEYDDGKRGGRRKSSRPTGSQFFELEAQVDSDEDEDEEEGEDDFIVDNGPDLPDEEDGRRMHRRPLLPREDDQEDVEELERSIQARYAKSSHTEYNEETTDVEQQALLPSVQDPKLWMVKCAIGREREVAVCLMQKCIDKGPALQIRSVIALDHLKNYVYVEANKKSHVEEAIKGMRNIFSTATILLVPIKEMTDVLSVESKAIDLSRDTWVRMKIGTYKNDLAKVVDVDNVRQRVTVKLIPRIDLQALANKLKTLAVSERELCKYFEPGNHVKVVSGATEGATGMVLTVQGHLVNIVSDTTKEVLRVFSDNVVESSEVTAGITQIGDYELHDLVLLDNMSFGVIIRVESDALQVLKGVPDRPEVALVRLREIKYKIDRKNSAQDQSKNTISVKDVVKILDGPCKGKQGPVEHIYRGILFIFDRHHLEHAGFICAKSQSCMLVGGSRANGDRNNGHSTRRFSQFQAPRIPQSPGRFSRGGPPNHFGGGRHGRGGGRGGHDPLVGMSIKVRLGPFKGYKGRVIDVKGTSVRVELESQMKVITVDRKNISDNLTSATPYRDAPRYGAGSETPMHPSRTPLHPYMTPMRDAGATPIHDGMRTPMRDRAWNPYTPMSPPRESWESWGSSPQYQVIKNSRFNLLITLRNLKPREYSSFPPLEVPNKHQNQKKPLLSTSYPSNWSSLIRNCISQGSPKEALIIYKQVRCNRTYAMGVIPLLLKACASLSEIQYGRGLHCESIKSGVEFDVILGSSLINMYAKCGELIDARKMFDYMPERNVVTWNSMIGSYMKSGDTQNASLLFERMSTRTPVSWIEMIDGYARKGDTVVARKFFDKVSAEMRNVVTWTVMVDGYASNGEMEAAREVFDQMPQRNFFAWSSMVSGYFKKGDAKEAKAIFDRIPSRNLVNWNSLISGYTQNGLCEDALDAFTKMQAEGFDPDEVTVTSVLSACAQLGSLDAGKEIHIMILEKRIKFNHFIRNSLVDMYAKCGDLVNARAIFEGIPQKNEACWNAMISGFAIHGQCKEAIEFFEQMEKSSEKPDEITFLSVLSACSHGGFVQEGMEIFSKMGKYELRPNIKHYGCLVDLLGRAGKLVEAYDLIKGMRIKPNDMIWGSLLGACRIHANVGMANRVVEELSKIDHDADNCGVDSHFVLVSNIYKASERWEAGEKIRVTMSKKGFQKMPGCSSLYA